MTLLSLFYHSWQTERISKGKSGTFNKKTYQYWDYGKIYTIMISISQLVFLVAILFVVKSVTYHSDSGMLIIHITAKLTRSNISHTGLFVSLSQYTTIWPQFSMKTRKCRTLATLKRRSQIFISTYSHLIKFFASSSVLKRLLFWWYSVALKAFA